jgi:hypothetical protein
MVKSLLEKFNEEHLAEGAAERYLKQYPDHMKALESHSLLSKVRSITPYDIYALGMQLDAFQAYKKFCEDDGTISALGTIPNIALDVITATYGTSPLSVIASVQPIDEERGNVYYKQVIAETTKSSITAGQSVWDTQGAPQTILQNYASSTNTVLLGTTGSSASSSYNFTLTSALLPIRPGKVSVTYAGSVPLTAVDDGNGNLLGQGFWGTVNYTTGAFVVYFNTLPTINTNINATIDQVYDGATNIPQINFKLASKAVVANLFALKDTVGLEQSYAMRRRFGMIAEDELTKDLVASINSEIVNTLIINLVAATPSANMQTFAYTPPSGVSYLENKQHLKDILSFAEASIITSANRGNINVMIAGAGAASIMSTLPGFVRLSDGSSMGPHIFGTLDGTIIVRVPLNAILGSYTVLGLYKGSAPFDGACVWAPYMPLVVTTALPVGTNPLQQQKAAAVMGAAEVLLPNFISQITITGGPSI